MTYSSRLASHYLELARRPILTNNWSGEDARYSGEFELLETEVAKGSGLHGNGPIDWQRIQEQGEALLTGQSKDLRVASWLTWSLYQRESFVGLHAGLGLLEAVCAGHWTELHPRKARTRAAAFAWLLPRLEQALVDQVPLSEQLPLFRSIAAHLHAIERVLSAELGPDAPLLLPLCRKLDDMLDRASRGQPEPGSVSAAITQVKQVAQQVLTGQTPLDNDKDAQKALRNLQEQARPLAAWWLKQKATDPRPLRLSRTLLWLNIDSLPERNAEQVTALRNLPSDKLAAFRERLEQALFADLIVDLETSIARAPFWLDGQRLVWECLQGLDATPAMRELEIQLGLFLVRLPGLDELKFHEGTPFADGETRAWIGAHVMPHLHRPKATREAVASETPSLPAWDTGLQDALPLLRKEGLKPAVQRLKVGLAAAQGERERFHWQLALARLCISAKKFDLAKTQLESLDQTLAAAGLDDWEPALALDVLRLLHHCCEVLPQNHAVRESKDEIYRRLCHLDLEVVLD